MLSFSVGLLLVVVATTGVGTDVGSDAVGMTVKTQSAMTTNFKVGAHQQTRRGI